MLTHILPRHLLAALSLGLLGCSAMAQNRQPLAPPYTPPVQQNPSASQLAAERAKATESPLAISDAHTRELMQRFSESRSVFSAREGAQIYTAVCQACHMAQGEGATGTGFYPPLANSVRISASAYVAVVVLRGMHAMPPFQERLDDEQVANVVNYVRTHFGNNYNNPISPAEVAELRKSLP